MQLRYSLALSALLGSPAFAAGLSINLEVPPKAVSEYHRPYVAIWLERADQSVPGTLAVWYEVKHKDNEGLKYLKDLRQWWRRTGRELLMPVDGVSSATRPVGKHALNFDNSPVLAKLAPGSYKLVIEAAREQGGREVLTFPFAWPAPKAEQWQQQGTGELGNVSLEVRP